MTSLSNNIVSEVTEIQSDLIGTLTTIDKKLRFGITIKTVLGTATSFLIAFAWRDAIREMIDKVIGDMHMEEYKIWHKYPNTMYAIAVTIIGIVALYMLGENKFNVD